MEEFITSPLLGVATIRLISIWPGTFEGSDLGKTTSPISYIYDPFLQLAHHTVELLFAINWPSYPKHGKMGHPSSTVRTCDCMVGVDNRKRDMVAKVFRS